MLYTRSINNNSRIVWPVSWASRLEKMTGQESNTTQQKPSDRLGRKRLHIHFQMKGVSLGITTSTHMYIVINANLQT